MRSSSSAASSSAGSNSSLSSAMWTPEFRNRGDRKRRTSSAISRKRWPRASTSVSSGSHNGCWPRAAVRRRTTSRAGRIHASPLSPVGSSSRSAPNARAIAAYRAQYHAPSECSGSSCACESSHANSRSRRSRVASCTLRRCLARDAALRRSLSVTRGSDDRPQDLLRRVRGDPKYLAPAESVAAPEGCRPRADGSV